MISVTQTFLPPLTGMFATPIIYPSSLVPDKRRWLIALNPLTGQIEAYRAAFFGKPFDWFALGISTIGKKEATKELPIVCAAHWKSC